MSVETEDIIEKDEDLKATESRIVELRKKTDRTPEEEEEFKQLKQHHRGRVEEQILSAREESTRAREEAARAKQELEDARARLKEIQDKNSERSESAGGGENESVMINGQKFYTDEAIALRVQKGLMTQKEGWNMQRQAIKEEAKAEMRGDEPKQEWMKVRKDSLEYVKSKGYGWMLDAKDPKHNPNDPVFKIADKLWRNGYQNDPDGPRKALEDALEYSGKNIKREDRSDDFGIAKNNVASDSFTARERKVELSEIERGNAIRYWPTINNPKTGKYYTEAEALAKALDAKRKRLSK